MPRRANNNRNAVPAKLSRNLVLCSFMFLQEYLDDVCETVFSIHWKDITYKCNL